MKRRGVCVCMCGGVSYIRTGGYEPKVEVRQDRRRRKIKPYRWRNDLHCQYISFPTAKKCIFLISPICQRNWDQAMTYDLQFLFYNIKVSVHNEVYCNNQLTQSPNIPPIAKSEQPTYRVAQSSDHHHRQRHSKGQSKAWLLHSHSLLTWLLQNLGVTNTLKDLKMAATPPSLKIPWYINMLFVFQVICLAQDVSSFTVKSSLTACALEASSFHITPVIGFQTVCDVTSWAHRLAS